MTLRGEPTWAGLAAPASGPSVNGTAGARPAAARSAGPPIDDISALEDLEAEVLAARDLHGEERTQARRLLTKARSRMAETTYRRALVLARDSALLTVKECIEGARAMEWEPLPRPEFSLATIEAAVAEQERHDAFARELNLANRTSSSNGPNSSNGKGANGKGGNGTAGSAKASTANGTPGNGTAANAKASTVKTQNGTSSDTNTPNDGAASNGRGAAGGRASANGDSGGH